MFAQVIRFTLKADALQGFLDLDRRWETDQASIAPGFKGSYVLREQDTPNRCMMVVLFDSRDLAQQNSDRPETGQWYGQLLQLVEGEPEFIGTDVVNSYLI